MKLICKIKNEKILKIAYVMLSIVFVLPSIVYLIRNKTVFKFNQWFRFFLDDTKIELQTLSYIVILAMITLVYVLIIKNRKKIFENIKSVLKYVAIVGFIYILSVPFTCSDVFYYMGVGRIASNYNQNPYYRTIKQCVQDNKENLEQLKSDTVLMQGYINDWSDDTVVYGPIWQLICKGVAFLSFGNIDLGLLIFKILNLLIHLINCYFIYKISGKKIFAIIYGLNPFVLIEGIMCVHNDIFVAMFTILSIYFMKNKNKLWISMILLACATAIKYFSILLLPFMLIYYFRKEKIITKVINCVKYGIIFVLALIVPYLLYIQDFTILNGMATQQGKIAKSIYIPITEFFSNISITTLSSMLLKIFVIIYFFACLIILFKKEIRFRELIQKYTKFLLIFIFLLITQFQPWYLIWLMPIYMWNKANNVKVLVAIGIIAEFANAVFLLNGEGFQNGTPFVLVMYTVTLGYALIIEKMANKRKIRCFKKHIEKINSF